MAYVAEDDVKRSLKAIYTYTGSGGTTRSSRTYPGLNVYTDEAAKTGTSAIDGAPFADVCMLFSSLLGDTSNVNVENYALIEEQIWSPE